MNRFVCPKCNADNSPGSSFCFKCGTKLETKHECDNCKYVLSGSEDYCPHCGKPTAFCAWHSDCRHGSSRTRSSSPKIRISFGSRNDTGCRMG